MARWRKGDFGRYRFEASALPSFEFHGRDAAGMVHLWHVGEDHVRRVPVETFLRDCVAHWVVQKVGVERPYWLVEGVRLKWVSQQVVVRRVHVDYFSLLDEGKLRFFHVADAERFFVRDVTVWDFLNEDQF